MRQFGVPYWALTHVFGRDPMSWYRLDCALGRASIVGTTFRKVELPQHLLADEHHQTRDGQKTSITTTVAEGCCLGAEPAPTAGTDDLKAASGVFRDEAHDVAPKYAPRTVNTDGWPWTQAAWKALFPHGVVLLCFLHAYLKIRDRAKHRRNCSRRSRGGSGRRLMPPTADVSGHGSVDSGSGLANTSAALSWRRSWTSAPSARGGRWRTVTPTVTARATCWTASCGG